MSDLIKPWGLALSDVEIARIHEGSKRDVVPAGSEVRQLTGEVRWRRERERAPVPDVWTYQATGDETEVYLASDDEAVPLILVPFLDSETPEEHLARVQRAVAALNVAEASAGEDRYAPG